jgi:hypothetical protein
VWVCVVWAWWPPYLSPRILSPRAVALRPKSLHRLVCVCCVCGCGWVGVVRAWWPPTCLSIPCLLGLWPPGPRLCTGWCVLCVWMWVLFGRGGLPTCLPVSCLLELWPPGLRLRTGWRGLKHGFLILSKEWGGPRGGVLST